LISTLLLYFHRFGFYLLFFQDFIIIILVFCCSPCSLYISCPISPDILFYCCSSSIHIPTLPSLTPVMLLHLTPLLLNVSSKLVGGAVLSVLVINTTFPWPVLVKSSASTVPHTHSHYMNLLCRGGLNRLVWSELRGIVITAWIAVQNDLI
jgi:hypothetical protein